MGNFKMMLTNCWDLLCGSNFLFSNIYVELCKLLRWTQQQHRKNKNFTKSI